MLSNLTKKKPAAPAARTEGSKGARASGAGSDLDRYLMAQKMHDDRILRIEGQRRAWMYGCFGALGVIAVLAVSLTVVVQRSGIWIAQVEVDKHGDPRLSGWIDPVPATNDQIERAFVGRFVEDWRNVSIDRAVQRSAVKRLFAMMADKSPAFQKVGAQFAEKSPYAAAMEGTVEIEFNSILKTADSGWQVKWTETSRNIQGGVKDVSKFTAVLSVLVQPPRDQKQAMLNPIGMYVKNLQVSKDF